MLLFNVNVKHKGGDKMSTEKKIYIDALEMAEILGVSRGFAYKIIRKLNMELKDKGYIVIAGKVPRSFFKKRWYGFKE